MTTKRKLIDFVGLEDLGFDYEESYYAKFKHDHQIQRELYASKIKNCAYHDIFSRISDPLYIRNISSSEMKASPVVARDRLYQPLDPFQIRVLHIEPGEIDEPLRTLLCTVDLLLEGGAVDPKTRCRCTYEAVSYSWGDDRIGGIMHCNDQIMTLRESQHTMLKHLRSKSTRRSIWLDTVCINQHDISERADQVRKMFIIFKHAQRVLVWLGIPKSRTAQVFAALTKMKATRLLHKQHPLWFFREYRDGPPQALFIPDMCSACHCEFEFGIGQLFTFPWFRRTWVRQEIFASRVAILLCGSLEISWPVFVSHIRGSVARLLNRSNCPNIDTLTNQLLLLNRRTGKTHLDDEDNPTGSLSFVHQLFDQQITQYSDGGADLFHVLANSASFDSTDPRDIIYGVVGMSNTLTSDHGTGQPFLAINYHCDASDVFRNATEYFIRREKCLDAMFLAQFNRDPRGETPSWCPHWPVMNCKPELLRQLCHVILLDKHSNRISLAFDGKSWPRVINSETIDMRPSEQPNDFCSFEGVGIQIEGHALGTIRGQIKENKARDLALTALSESILKPTTTTTSGNSKEFNKACNNFVPLRIEHADMVLSAFREEAKRTNWPQEEIDRLCVASVPSTSTDGDLLCFLRASSAFVVLRPLKLKSDICRAHFVGIAFASEGIFDRAKLMGPDAYNSSLAPRLVEEQDADIVAFNRIVNQASKDDQYPDDPSLTPTATEIDSDGFGDEEGITTRSREQTPRYEPVIAGALAKQDIDSTHAETRFQQHFDGPIKSLKLTFDIV